jgi:hypothetical protein
MNMNEQLLKDYVATAQSGNHADYDSVNAKFPEFKDVDPQILKDYVATVDSGEYSSWDEVNAKFPEFSSVGAYGALDIVKADTKIPDIKAVVEEPNPLEKNIKNNNVKNIFDINNSITSKNEKAQITAAETYFDFEKLGRSTGAKPNHARYEEEQAYIKEFFKTEGVLPVLEENYDKYEEYKRYRDYGQIPTSDNFINNFLNPQVKVEKRKKIESYISNLDESEIDEAILNLPDLMGMPDAEIERIEEAFLSAFNKDDYYRRLYEGKIKGQPQQSLNHIKKMIVKGNPKAALQWEANYLSSLNDSFTKTYEEFELERTSFLTNNKDILSEYEELEKEKKDLGNVTANSDKTLITTYNDIVVKQKGLRQTMKERGVFQHQDSLVAKQNRLQSNLDDLVDKSEIFDNKSMATNALVRDYSFLGRTSLHVENFIQGINVLAYAGLAKTQEVLYQIDKPAPPDRKYLTPYYKPGEVPSQEEINKDWEERVLNTNKNFYKRAVNYKEELGIRIQDLPLTIKADEINGSNIWRATSQMLANNSPSIIIALGTMGYGTVAGAGLNLAARATVINRGSKMAMLAFGLGEGGGKLADMEIMKKYASKDIIRIEAELAGEITNDRKIQLQDELVQANRALNYTQLERGLSAFLYGGTAAYAERLGTLGYLKRLQMAKPRFANSWIKSTLYTAGQTAFVLPGIELIEETATQLAHNFIDIQLGEDRGFVDGIDKDFALNTAFTSLAIQGPSRSINMFNGIKSAVSNRKERQKSLGLTQDLIETQAALSNDKLSVNERKALVQQKRDLIEQLNMADVLTVQKVARMSEQDIRDLFDVDRQQRKVLRDIRQLGGQNESQTDKKQKQKLVDKYNSLDAQKEFLTGKPQKNNEKKLKEVLKVFGLELGVDINPGDVAEIHYQMGKYQALKDMTDGVDNIPTRIFEGDNVQQDFFNYLDQRVKDNSLTQAEADRLKSKKKLPYAAVVGGQQVLFQDEIYKAIASGGAAAKFAAVAPLHELTHKWLKDQGVVTKDGDIAEWSLKAIESIEGRLNEMIENNLIEENIGKSIRKRINQYKEGEKVNLEEMVTLLGDLKSQGIISREQKNIINNLKIFFDKIAGKALQKVGLGDMNMFMRFDTFEDISRYIDSFQENVKQGAVILPPDDEVQPGSQLSEAYAGLDADLLINISKTTKSDAQLAGVMAEITKQFDNLALNALGFDQQKGDISRDNVVAAAREFLPGIVQRFDPATAKFSTFVDVNMRPKRQQIYEVAKTLQDREAKKLDAPEVKELEGDVNVSTNTAADEFIKKINVLGFNGVQNVLDDIAKLVKVKPGDTFKQIIERYADKIGELIFKVPAAKINDGTKNLTYAKKITDGIPEQSEAGNIQQFFNAGNNAERFIKILPPTNITSDTADINKIPENIDVSRSVLGLAIGLKGRALNYFYKKTNKRSKGLTSQTPIWELKEEFKNPTPETIEQFKKDLGITPKGELNNYDRNIGQMLKGVAKVYSINAALSAAQRFQEIKTKVAPKEQRKAIKQQTADITTAQSKTAFSEVIDIGILDQNAVEEVFEMDDITHIDKLLGLKDQKGIFRHRTQTEIDQWFDAFEKVIIANLPENVLPKKRLKSILRPSDRIFAGKKYNLEGNGKDLITVKGKEISIDDYYQQKRDDLLKKDLTYGAEFKGEGAKYVYGQTYAKQFGTTEAKIKNSFNDGTVAKQNKINLSMHQQMWGRINESIKDTKNKSLRAWGSWLSMVGQDTEHPHRMGAELLGYSVNPKGVKVKNKVKLYEWEHAMPATRAYLYLLNAAADKKLDFTSSYILVSNNFKLIALDAMQDLKLKNAKRATSMGKNWSILTDSWLDRYFDIEVAKVRGGINPSTIMHLSGKNFADQYNIANVGKVVEQNKLVENKADQALIVSSKTVESKGITILDFDDTLATTKSLVRFTALDGTTGTLNAEQFANTYQDLLEQGYTFDFSDFNKVVKGKLAPLFQKALKLQKKFGAESMFVLTARPQQAAQAIFDFLAANGLNIPLKNITGLTNSTSEAKALWVAEKVGEGYNDFYFADDALQNVQAVKNILNQFDVKSKVRQAKTKFSESLSIDLNKMIEVNEDVGAEKVFSSAEAALRGAKKGKMKFYIPPGAEDFMGLMYIIANAKGKKGEAQIKFFEDNILKPYQAGVRKIDSAKQQVQDAYKDLLKEFPELKKGLKEQVPSMNFTVDAAVRVYLWDKAGFDIPDISKTAKARLIKHVQFNNRLVQFADSLSLVSKRKEGYTKPEVDWIAQTILSDLDVATNVEGRKEHLNEFIENINATFSKENLNKLEAIYGLDFVEALRDMIFRMKSGKNRNTGSTDRQVARWTTWIQNSVGAIMFLNMRSALLQTISSINFVNWSDNNPAKAAAALVNIKQFTKDFAMIFNSDFLKQRRSGLKTDVNEAALANAMAGKKNKAQALLAYLLKKGFTPTQIADSFAIASGGATFYRNRVNTYLKQGLNKKDAKTKAFADMQTISEVSQQSADPSLISKQQASILGRFILAFQNTPMQYARLTKKAAIDLIKGRGDWKSNVSKIVYYAAIQNIIFSALQSALFALAFQDTEEEEKDRKTDRLTNTVVDSLLRGTGIYGAVVATAKNIMLEFWKQDKKDYRADHAYTLLQFANISPPIGSKLRKMYSSTQTRKFNKDVMKEVGFSFNNPIVPALGTAVEAFTNLPLGRAIQKINNARAATQEDVEMWQRMALLMGWNTWDLGVDNKEIESIRKRIKQRKKNLRKSKKSSSKEFGSSSF